MRVYTLYHGGFTCSCYYVTDDAGEYAVVVDPGVSPAYLPADARKLRAKLVAILLTHTHYDHMMAMEEWRAESSAPVMVPRGDARGFSDPVYNVSAAMFGTPAVFPAPEGLLDEGDVIPFGDSSLRVLLTPGHTAGGCSYYGTGILFTGDTLFADGQIGRQDLSGGSGTAIAASVKRILSFPPDTVIYPGHGGSTTIAAEQIYFA